MKILKYIVVVTFSMILLSCTNSETTDLKSEIQRLETKIMNAKSFDILVSQNIVEKYDEFANKNPKSKETPEYIFKAGRLLMNMNKGKEAIEHFNNIYSNYKEYSKVPDCLFLMGFVYENTLHNNDKAKLMYQTFIEKYPKHEMADDAKASIANIGIPLEDLIKTFEKNSQKDTVGKK